MNKQPMAAPSSQQIERRTLYRRERQLLFKNLELVLAHQKQLLTCDDYFFCRPIFSTYGFYSTRSMILGSLLLGWQTGILRQVCPRKLSDVIDNTYCDGTAYIYHFGGTGAGTRWSGFCATCGSYVTGDDSAHVHERFNFVQSIQDQCKDWVDGLEIQRLLSPRYNFGEPSVVPTRVNRTDKVRTILSKNLAVEQLIIELRTGPIRGPTNPGRRLRSDLVTIPHREGNASYQVDLLSNYS